MLRNTRRQERCAYDDIEMTIMMMGDGTFTIKDWDEITAELKLFWWPFE